ncbi:MAG: endonuclease III [Coriobacteriales bacterium]|jgi:endonuclease-3|nr:endonuclease III [Coriobacteriales bacterium]
MPRESRAAKTQRANALLDCLAQVYPVEEKCLLQYHDAFSLLISVMLSAQTTDAAVDKVTPVLFSRWPDPASLAAASVAEVSETIHSLGFYHTKAKNCVLCAQKLLADFGGDVPDTMAELISLPGVGRKTANIVLNCAFNRAEGIAVDTHVFRIARRWRLSAATEPTKVEQDLLKVIDSSRWSMVNHSLVLFGREYCDARNPRCASCPVVDLCPAAP